MRRKAIPSVFLCLLSAVALLALFASSLSFAAAPDRVVGTIDSSQMVRFSAGVPLKAQSQYDQGPVDPSFKLTHMTLLTVPSASQKKDLAQFLAEQQDQGSASYHQWLSPEQYADRFGLSSNDIQKIRNWLQFQGFTIQSVARGRNWIVFSGTAAQAEAAFQTTIHSFNVDGEKHFSNITPPSIPAALSGIVAGVRGLSNFRPKSYVQRRKPDYTYPIPNTNPQAYNLFLAPGDIETIYDIGPLYAAGIDGTGQSLAVMGQTDVYLADLDDFRSNFGLSTFSPACTTNAHLVITSCDATNFKYVLNGTDTTGLPNAIEDDLTEADLDIEWSGAVAKNAQIIYVNSPDPNGNGVWDSWYYAVDNKVAPVITLSYGLCELGEASNGAFASDEAELQKANSEGITFMNSSGDSGAAECDPNTTDRNGDLATGGLAVSYPASSPEVTGVGGNMIPDGEYNATYWSTTNASNGGSAVMYIPENPWNDSTEFGAYCIANPTDAFCTKNGITNAETAQSAFGISATGGGPSNCYTTTNVGKCTGGFPQPTWQENLSISGQTTKARFVPDVSLLASPDWPGYILCTAQSEQDGFTGSASTCASGISDAIGTYDSIVGGTSASTPVFAGMVTLLNHYIVKNGLQSAPGLGNINPSLYQIATVNPTAFHPVTAGLNAPGGNQVYCQPGTPSGQPSALICPAAVAPATEGLFGYLSATADPTTSYNLVTGLGSVDAYKLATVFASSGAVTTTTVTSSVNPANFAATVSFTAIVTTAGSTAPTGTVTFQDSGTSIGTGTLATVGSSQEATFATSTLSSGTHSITAVYGGDSNNAGSTSGVLSQVIGPPFTLSTPTTPAPVPAGESTMSTFTVTPVGGKFVEAVTFACGGLPDATVTCAFNPTQIAAGVTTEQTVSVTITTSGPNASASAIKVHRRADNRYPWIPLGLPLAGIVLAGFAGRKVSRYSAIAGLCILLALVGLLVACGSGSSSPAVEVRVSQGGTVYPSYANWPANTPQTTQFTATVTNSTNTAVTWAVTTPNGGSITSAGLYTAPATALGLPASAIITATSQANTTAFGSATETIKPTTVPTAVVGGPYKITVAATEGATTIDTSTISLTVQ
jgi:subtilase family serine protease